MSANWVQDIADMHDHHFGDGGLYKRLLQMDDVELRHFWKFRVNFLKEELRELEQARTAEDALDALIDLCVVAIGTMDAFGADSHMAWGAVLEANMAKKPGVNPNRPNPFGLPDLIKPEGWKAPNHQSYTELLDHVFMEVPSAQNPQG